MKLVKRKENLALLQCFSFISFVFLLWRNWRSHCSFIGLIDFLTPCFIEIEKTFFTIKRYIMHLWECKRQWSEIKIKRKHFSLKNLHAKKKIICNVHYLDHDFNWTYHLMLSRWFCNNFAIKIIRFKLTYSLMCPCAFQ